jgi:hypothetical protein
MEKKVNLSNFILLMLQLVFFFFEGLFKIFFLSSAGIHKTYFDNLMFISYGSHNYKRLTLKDMLAFLT